MNGAPPRALLGLTVAVVAAHLWLLRGAPLALHAPDEHAHPFVTRTVALAPPAPPAAAVPAPAAPPPAARLPRESQPTPAPQAETRAPKPAAQAAPRIAQAALAVSSAAEAPAPSREAAPPAAAMAVAIPGSMRLLYRVDVRKGVLSLQANSELRWRHDADTYEARLEVSAPLLPTRTQHSTGRITAEGLAPLRFSDKGRTEEAAHFEREKGKVSFSNNRPDAALLPGAQDRLSVLLQLAAMLAGEPAKFPPGTTITIQTAGTHDAEPWLFTVEGDEQLHLPGGNVAARKLIRNPRKEYDLKVELWLAPGMDYVPVRLRLTQPNGDSVDQQWASTDKG